LNEKKFMALALELAEKGRGLVSPNPMVGAVIVKGGRVVGRGWHARYGEAHAEVNALRKAGKRVHGATAYVSLEPCGHWGRQPPCTQALLDAGISKVVYACRDPSPWVNGRGHHELAKAGIKVKGGVLEREAQELNRAYFKRVKTGLSWVVLKVAMSADGKIAGQKGKWITGKRARKEGQRLRVASDAVLTGIGTVLKDDPRLTVRGKREWQPLRLVVDSRLRMPLNARMLREEGRTVVFTTKKAAKKKIKALEGRKGVEVVVGKEKHGEVDLKWVMKELGDADFNQVLVEAGRELNTALLKAGLVDELALFVAPKRIGAKGLDVFDATALKGWKTRLTGLAVKRLGVDWLLAARLRP